MTEQTFRTKPIEIQAIQTADALTAARTDWQSLPAWLRAAYDAGIVIFLADRILILTLEREMRADPFDWLIQDVQGKLSPRKPDIFAATYEPFVADEHFTEAPSLVTASWATDVPGTGDDAIPSPTAPEAPDRTEEQWTMRYLINGEPQLGEDNGHIFDSRDEAARHIGAWRTLLCPQRHYTDVEYLRRTVTYGPWQPAPAEPEGTPDA